MIGKHIPSPKSGGSFGGLNDYISGKSKRRLEDEKVAFVDCVNLISIETATTEMESVAYLNKRCGNPVMHLLLSWKENEQPTREQVREAVNITLDEMKLSQCQAVYALHQNTDNMHLHICVNRVDPDTFKAINPAHGWTRRGMERVARRIEHAQGWRVENNTWSEIDERGKAINKPLKSEDKIPQTAQDKENLSGEQSAIRKAQGVLKPALKDIKSWKELHGIMRENGMKYEKKGSGAVIHVGEIIVKASNISRNLALTKLGKQFGEYEPPAVNLSKINEREHEISEPKPLEKANDNERWRAYISERNGYYKGKKSERSRLSMSHEEQRKEIKLRQAAERRAMYESCAGQPRKQINEQRSILATRHAYDAVLLKEAQRQERQEFQKKNPGYVTYEQWLRGQGHDDEAEAWRHRRDDGYFRLEITGEGEARGETNALSGLPGFGMVKVGNGRVRFFREDSPGVTAFVDTGQKIRLYQIDDEAILAALQLGQQKWGSVKIDGTDEYKRRCAELAAEHGIRIANPELRELIQRIQRAKELSGPEPGKRTGERTENTPPVSPSGLTYAELEKLRRALNAKLDAEAEKIAEPQIAEAAREQIKIEAGRVKTEKAAIYKSYSDALAARDVHAKKEPPEPLFFGRAVWEKEHKAWVSHRDAHQRRLEELWEKAGGSFGHDEVKKRQTDEYALEEAKKRYDRSGEWAAIAKGLNDRAREEAERRDPAAKEALGAADRELEKREPEKRIAVLDKRLERGGYSVGSAGFSMLAETAMEVIKLEMEYNGVDEREAMERHPKAAATLSEYAKYKQRSRGMGR